MNHHHKQCNGRKGSCEGTEGVLSRRALACVEGGYTKSFSTTLIRNEMPGTPSAIMVQWKIAMLERRSSSFHQLIGDDVGIHHPPTKKKESLVKSLDTMAQN